jgi:signal transduction histidine kinase
MEALVPERFHELYRGRRMNFSGEPRVPPMGAKLELCGLHKAGAEFPVEVSLGSIDTGEGTLVTSAIRDITERKRSEEALASVSRRLIEAQEQERTRIARELHDDIVQRLALLAIRLEQLQQSSPDVSAEVCTRLDELRNQTSEIANDIQSLSHELHSAKLEYLGIAAAMKGFCKEFGERQKVEIDFKTRDLPSVLPPDFSLCFFRVLQEALRNAAKHSGVRYFEVRLWGTPGEIHLTVRDSGTGFDNAAAKEGRGLGLISMEERLKLLNGRFSVESQAQGGTTIYAHLYLGSKSDSLRTAIGNEH